MVRSQIAVEIGVQETEVLHTQGVNVGAAVGEPGDIPLKVIASNAMTRTQTIICFSVREPGAALSPLAIRFECVHISVFC